MLFNSFIFLVFLPIVFVGYWCLFGKSRMAQNLFVIIASYVFYGWWDWRFLLLMMLTTLVAWATALAMPRSGGKGAKLWLSVSLIINLGVLGVFKYFNFFVASAGDFLALMGFSVHLPVLQILLPVGISFYTFQALSYTIDVYRGTIKPVKDFVAFTAFISFFPQLVAGPIERATNLLPQFLKDRKFDYDEAVSGCRLMLWGFAKKVLLADMCAKSANQIFGMENPSTIAVWLGALCFTFQIYGDFSGYSDIAIGCGRLFGIRLNRNFAHPYFARDIAEFWRRWHISLTTWFRDYLYIPLGGSRCGTAKKIRNTFIIFLVSGFWHGANWTFIAWGAFHAMCFMPLLLLKRNRIHTSDVVAEGRMLPSLRELTSMITTFFFVVIGWVFFRANALGNAGFLLKKMLFDFDFHLYGQGLFGFGFNPLNKSLIAILVFSVVEWFGRMSEIPILPRNLVLRWIVYLTIIFLVLLLRPSAQTFIYFQF